MKPAPLSDAEIADVHASLPITYVHPEYARAIESEVNARWQKMLAGQVPVAELTIDTFEMFRSLTVGNVASDLPNGEYQLFTHPASDHTSILRQALHALQYMVIEQGREGFGDEMDDIKMALDAISAIREAINVPR